jgi:hypothetical protein
MRKEISFLGKDIVKNPPFHIGHIGLQHLEESKVCWHDMGANDPTHQCAVASDAGLESGGSRVAETSNSGFYELTATFTTLDDKVQFTFFTLSSLYERCWSQLQ